MYVPAHGFVWRKPSNLYLWVADRLMLKRTPVRSRSVHRRGADRVFGPLLVPGYAGVRLVCIEQQVAFNDRRNRDESTATGLMT